jgi:hypothetical protein
MYAREVCTRGIYKILYISEAALMRRAKHHYGDWVTDSCIVYHDKVASSDIREAGL